MLVERIFLGRPANYAIIAVRLNGSFSTSQFIEVLSKLRKKHPLLGTRVIFDLNNYAWLTNEGVPEIPVVEMKLTKEDQWIDIVKKEHKHIFHLKQGPLIRFTLLKDTNSIDLIVNCHHSICDGLSLAYLIRDILVHLTNPNEEIEPILNAAPLNKKSIPFKAKRSILMALLIKTINRFWKKNEIRFSQNDYQNLTKVFWDKNSCEIIAWQLNGSQTSKLIKGCKEVLRIVKSRNVKTAILKNESPSCGCGKTWRLDDNFVNHLVDGDGVLTVLLKKNGIKVYTEENFV